MSYSYDDPIEGIDYEVCEYCDGTGGSCVDGYCDMCTDGVRWMSVPWEYRDYMQEQQARDKAEQR